MRASQALPANAIADLPESYDLRSLNIVQSQTDHLERLVNDLLDLSRVQWGELHLQYSSFYLADVLAECVRQAQISAEEHTIYLDIASQDSKIVADKLRVGQIVGNILDNAIKFSPQGKQVTVKLQEQGNEYQVSVNDEGIGVSPEFFDHIFVSSEIGADKPDRYRRLLKMPGVNRSDSNRTCHASTIHRTE